MLNALTVTGETSDPVTTVQAVQLMEDDLVQCVALTPHQARLDTGMRVMDTGGPIRIPLEPGTIERVISSVELSTPTSPSAMLETGIKMIDPLMPLPRHGRIALVGDMQSGKMVLVEELIHRLANTDSELKIFVFAQTPDEVAVVNALEYRASHHVDAIYLPVADANPQALEHLTSGLDAVITFSSSRVRQGLFPAIDPLQSRSSLLEETGERHQDMALRVRDAISIQGRGIGQHLDAFFVQPFYVAEAYTGREGTHVTALETLQACDALLAEGVPPEA